MNATAINTLNIVFPVGTIALIAASLLLIVGIATRDKSKVFELFHKRALLIIFLVSFIAMVGSLTYQFIGFVPCPFCWYQRIFMYPIAFISLTALIRNRTNEIFNYVFVLSTAGGIIALWHNIEKIMGRDVLACDAVGASCLSSYVKGFGFVDIPVMSLVMFVFVILIIITRKRFK